MVVGTQPELAQTLERMGADGILGVDSLRSQRIELPSWAFGNSGTRFKVFSTPGDPSEAIVEA